MRKANFFLSRIGRKKAWPTGRLRKIIISLNLRRRILCLKEILRTIRPKTILITRISKEIGIVHPTIRTILRVKKLQIIMEILPRVLSVKSLSSAGNVMACTMLQSVQTGRRLLATFILYRRR